MAPSKKSRSVNKRFSYINEVASNKDGENASKSKQRKRKLSDMLGPQWSKEELVRFYEAFRKYGKDWRKVAVTVRNRSMEMVEALYTMNRAYLSLPEGTASVVGLIAMMTDHYSVLGGSDSEQESNEDTGASRKQQKIGRGKKSRSYPSKGSDKALPGTLQPQSAASNYGCLSLLKKRRSGSGPRAVGKRTPRVPVSNPCAQDIGEKYFSPIRQGMKVKADAVDDDVAHEIALALTEASQRGGSPQVSQTPTRKTEMSSPVQVCERMHAESEMTSVKHRGSEMDEGGCELSLGSTEADDGVYARNRSYLVGTEGAHTVRVSQKGKKYLGKKPEMDETVNDHLNDIKEACSGTEEGQKQGTSKLKFETEVSNVKPARSSYKSPRKRSKKVLFGADECSAFDALQTLADLSLMPETTFDAESSVRLKEEKTGIVEKYKHRENHSAAAVKTTAFESPKLRKAVAHDTGTPPEVKETHQINAGVGKRRRRSSPLKTQKSKDYTDSRLSESHEVETMDKVKHNMNKSKHSHAATHSRQGRLGKSLELISPGANHGKEWNDTPPSTTEFPSANQIYLPTKVRSRRKIDPPKPLIEKDTKSSENIVNSQSFINIPSSHDRAVNLKKMLSNCLSRYKVRRWCVFEWFYSAIDYPWFAKREFVEYLDHVGLGHVPRLTRVEWGVIRSSLGKPRRFSKQFLKEEKDKLNQYRESVRKHYAELREGIRDGLPTDLARPLSVGQRVIAIHPSTGEVHDGSVLTIDHSRCRVQFDQPELGVEYVMDINCMPSNPLENMPAGLIKLNCTETLNELKLTGQPIERKMDGYLKITSYENLENFNASSQLSPSTFDNSGFIHQGGLLTSNSHDKAGLGEIVSMQQGANSQPSTLAQNHQAKEADIQAISELSRALEKKEAVVSELKLMNDEVLENEKVKGISLKDSEPFKKQYAAILLQLNEANEEVSSALFRLRERNTYQGNPPLICSKPVAVEGELGGNLTSTDRSSCPTQDYGSHVAEIVESSRTKAQAMVDAALQTVSSLRKEGISIERMEEAIDFVNNRLTVDDLSMQAMRSSAPAVPLSVNRASQDQLTATTSNPVASVHALDTKLNMSDQNEAQIPSELIANCVATLLMIQKCTERQFPPADVALVLDSAVTILRPSCSQNLPIYTEIQKCMGIIRNQILALIPT
ncbi:protein ALWAYS EARLY 3 isoform X2 [Tripterygium wilfordii]|uniref:protein ALWAYS EARLY 3 isoform X2 n=1 Tax=Tripterygium wilfordii TaxID=458696 RepID=UPI0018F8511A|nr:protein ALWAYS EARLY 3 isoform X2 [Tripterygium wilfordii]